MFNAVSEAKSIRARTKIHKETHQLKRFKHVIELNIVYVKPTHTHTNPPNLGIKLAMAGGCKIVPAMMAGEEF